MRLLFFLVALLGMTPGASDARNLLDADGNVTLTLTESGPGKPWRVSIVGIAGVELFATSAPPLADQVVLGPVTIDVSIIQPDGRSLIFGTGPSEYLNDLLFREAVRLYGDSARALAGVAYRAEDQTIHATGIAVRAR